MKRVVYIFHAPCLMKKRTGFTFIELLTALGIFVILALISIGVYFAFRPQNVLEADARSVESVLRLARTRTLASFESLPFGVHMQADRAILFQGSVFDSGDPTNEEIEFSAANDLYSIALAGGGSDVVFEKIIGTTQNFGTVSLRAKTDSSQIRTVYIQSIGAVSLEPPPAVSAPGYVRDSRHMHFTLGWSMQNATTLEFYFPANSQLESVAMAPFFNVGKTSFDTTQTFAVLGETQTFRVHTHSLTGTDTVLSIHRDRNNGQNTQQVEIRVVDASITKDIATWLADVDDTVQIGLYGGAMEAQ
jgi:prepilin-type N-terminal cleavage/methylation domain-containing protein